MIEDKELGLKIAENPKEAKWEGIKKQAEKSIEERKTEIEINKAIIELAEKKLKSLGHQKTKL